MRRILAATIALAALPSAPSADWCAPGIFDGIGRNALDSYSGMNALLPVAAVSLTGAMVSIGADAKVDSFFHRHQEWDDLGAPVDIVAQFGPLAIGAALFGAGCGSGDGTVRGAGCAVLQSLLLSGLTVTFLKAVTGRPGPVPDLATGLKRQSETFLFGFGRGGIQVGWPSGHMAYTSSMSAALIAYYPRTQWIKVATWGFMAYAAAGVCAHGGGTMHWASDAIAGALLGWGIGDTVGRYFRKRENGEPPGKPFPVRGAISPSGAPGIAVSFAL